MNLSEELVVDFEELLDSWYASQGNERRTIGNEIKYLARKYPTLADALPDEVYRQVYRVRSQGTRPPEAR